MQHGQYYVAYYIHRIKTYVSVGQGNPHACGARLSLCLIPHTHSHNVSNVLHMNNYV